MALFKTLLIHHKEKIQYLVTGIWNTIFGYGIFSLLHYLFKEMINDNIVLTISYIFSITNAYILYKLMVFKTKGNVCKEYIRFYFVYIWVYLMNIILLPIVTKAFNGDIYRSQAVIIILITIMSYFGNKKFTFKPIINEK